MIDNFPCHLLFISVQAPEIIQEESSPDTVEYESPYADPTKFYFADHFDDPENFKTKWVKSAAKKDDIAEEIAKYDGLFVVEAPQRTILKNDLGLVLKTKAKHAAISSRLSKPFVFTDKPLVVQYEVTMQEGQDCGGSYIKLLSSGPETTDLSQVRGVKIKHTLQKSKMLLFLSNFQLFYCPFPITYKLINFYL